MRFMPICCRRLKPDLPMSQMTFVTVDEVASAHMKELAAVYPVLNEDKAKEADVTVLSIRPECF